MNSLCCGQQIFFKAKCTVQSKLGRGFLTSFQFLLWNLFNAKPNQEFLKKYFFYKMKKQLNKLKVVDFIFSLVSCTHSKSFSLLISASFKFTTWGRLHLKVFLPRHLTRKGRRYEALTKHFYPNLLILKYWKQPNKSKKKHLKIKVFGYLTSKYY